MAIFMNFTPSSPMIASPKYLIQSNCVHSMISAEGAVHLIKALQELTVHDQNDYFRLGRYAIMG